MKFQKNLKCHFIWLVITLVLFTAYARLMPGNWSMHVLTIPLSLLWRSDLYAGQVDIIKTLSQVSVWPSSWFLLLAAGLAVSLFVAGVLFNGSIGCFLTLANNDFIRFSWFNFGIFQVVKFQMGSQKVSNQ